MPKSKGYIKKLFYFCTFQIEIYTEKDPFYEWTFFLFTNKREREKEEKRTQIPIHWFLVLLSPFHVFSFTKHLSWCHLHTVHVGCCIDDIMLILNNNGSKRTALSVSFLLYFYSTTTILHFKIGYNREHY